MRVLVVNCGSSSVKYEVVDTESRRSVARGVVERVGGEGGHAGALAEVLRATAEHALDAVGHRVVHGGATLTHPARVDDATLAAIEACVPLAPLHNPANLAGIRAAMAARPDLPHVAVFDTAFHHTLPRRARTYAIDQALAERHGVRRYGFHGTSHAFVAGEAARHLRVPLNRLRLISCHLGNGASVCAIDHAHSVETSMGMTPLEGLVMGTRSGDLDPGALLALLRSGELDLDGLDAELNRRAGLLGVSGVSHDLRDLEERAAAGHDGARLAIAVFSHRVRKYIGAYAAAMGGVDAVVLTAGIGENAVAMRGRILQRLDFLGLILDEERNADARVGPEARVATISAAHSRVAALVVATAEELLIAEETAQVVRALTAPAHPGPIPIAVSARHVHLTEATFKELFGEDAELTARNPLSQPGQFAAHQTVNLIGPRRTIENVRILGPFRSRNQVEVSRTDEFTLGVDAPVRASGHTQGSAPITLEGPNGRVHLDEGLICAWRHVHMTPEDARAYGVEDGDEVEVRVSGGPRDLTFGDVLVRVSPKFKLEMHIDTDEANAAELSSNSAGELVPVARATGELTWRTPTAHGS